MIMKGDGMNDWDLRNAEYGRDVSWGDADDGIESDNGMLDTPRRILHRPKQRLRSPMRVLRLRRNVSTFLNGKSVVIL